MVDQVCTYVRKCSLRRLFCFGSRFFFLVLVGNSILSDRGDFRNEDPYLAHQIQYRRVQRHQNLKIKVLVIRSSNS